LASFEKEYTRMHGQRNIENSQKIFTWKT